MRKQLKFRENLSKLILNGEKTTTWRLFDDKDLKQEDELSLLVWETKEEFAKAKIVEVREVAFKDLTDEDWDGHEKFENSEEMYKTYSSYYNTEVNQNTLVKIIKFELEN